MLKHLISASSALWVIINLLSCFVLLLPPLILGRLIPHTIVSQKCTKIVEALYRIAVKVDTFWMQQVVGIELDIQGDASPSSAPVVISNHQSWFDIPLLQELMVGGENSRIVKFIVKREIRWVPIIGWVCIALDFPSVRRRKTHGTDQSDIAIIMQATEKHQEDSGALLIFPEGSRFSYKKQADRKRADAKKRSQSAPYSNLLRPKSGGLKTIVRHLPEDTPLLDVTINYHQKNVSLWKCLHGNPDKISISIQQFQLSDIEDVDVWLNQRWLQKDQLLSSK